MKEKMKWGREKNSGVYYSYTKEGQYRILPRKGKFYVSLVIADGDGMEQDIGDWSSLETAKKNVESEHRRMTVMIAMLDEKQRQQGL